VSYAISNEAASHSLTLRTCFMPAVYDVSRFRFLSFVLLCVPPVQPTYHHAHIIYYLSCQTSSGPPMQPKSLW
jgi:hypothetical protein